MGKEKVTIDESAGWEDPTQQHDFFGDVNLVEDVVSEVEADDIVEGKKKPVDNADPEAIKKAQEEEEEKLLDEQFSTFGVATEDEEEEEEEEEDDKKGKGTPTNKSSNLQTLEFLKEKGLIDYNLEEGEELTEAKAEEMLEDTWETSIETGVEGVIKDLPKEIKDLIKFSSKGGNIGDLLSKMATNASSGITKDSDITKEDVQISSVTMDLKKQGYDQEYIDAQIDFLKESKKLEAISKKSYDKIVAEQEADTESEVTRIAKEREDRKKSARTYKTNITTHIESLEEVGGLPVSKADKIGLPTYISDPSVELQDGRLVSEFQADLFKVMGDKDKVTLLAKLIKSDFDFSSIARKKQSEAARETRKAVQGADKKKNIKNTGVHKSGKKSVWDMLD